jgi:hypothetical protein
MRLRPILEHLSFFLWIIFTIFSISLAGVGIEGILFACFMLIASSIQPVHFPLGMVCVGGIGFLLSLAWRQIGVTHFHYLVYDSIDHFEEEDSPSRVLHDLIRSVESSAGYARNDARAKAKVWLISHASSLDDEDILLAKARFGYMLPADWGCSSPEQGNSSRPG